MIKKFITYREPQNLLLIINLMALLLLTYYKGLFDRYSLGFGLLLVLSLYLSNAILKRISDGDHYIFSIVTLLMSIGIMMIYRIDWELGVKQVIWFGVGNIVFFIAYFTIKYIKGWSKGLYLYLGLSITLFLATLIFGDTIKGAKNWIIIKGFSFQPAELIRLLFIFYMASYYEHRKKYFNKYIFLGTIYGFIGFLFIQKDLGSALLFYVIFLAIFYVNEPSRKILLVNLMGPALLALMSYFAFSHVRTRVITWLNPWEYISGMGYQITQSLFAIASGGFFGTGLGLGHPEFIPEVETDFIFSAICEELGLFTGMAIVMLFLMIVYRGFKITLKQRNTFYKKIALGITVMLGFQAFIILGGVTKLIPLTGITLPFVSYGGSSLVASFAALGILQVASEDVPIGEEEGAYDEKRG